MGKKIPRSFFEAEEVIFVGYSKKNEAFCSLIAEAFEKRGARVFPVNPDPAKFSRTVYSGIQEVPGRPEFAYVLTGKRRNAEVVESLAARGVKRIAFQSRMSADPALLSRCAELGLETVLACPMMALGGGFHRFHGFLAGVRG
jgi:predicted CoA-binding protein